MMDLAKLGLALQAGGLGFSGGNPQAVLEPYLQKQRDAEAAEKIQGLMAGVGIAGPQADLLSSMPLGMQQQYLLGRMNAREQDERRRAAAAEAAALRQREEDARRVALESHLRPTPDANGPTIAAASQTLRLTPKALMKAYTDPRLKPEDRQMLDRIYDIQNPEQPKPDWRLQDGYWVDLSKGPNAKPVLATGLPIEGGDLTAKDIQVEELVKTGVPRNIATGIAYGRYKLSQLGEVIDVSDGSVIGRPANYPPEEVATTSVPSFPRARDAFTVTGGVENLVNQGGDALGMGRVDPEASETRTDIKNINTQAMLLLSNNFPGRPSNLTRERIEQMLPQPGAFAGPDTSRDKADAVRDMLDVAIRGYQEIINDPRGYSSQQRSEARRWLSQYEELRNQYSSLGQSLGRAGHTTSTGIQWSIEE